MSFNEAPATVQSILVAILINAAKFRSSSSVVKTSPPSHGSAIIHTGYGSRVDEIRKTAASASSSDAQHDLSAPMRRTAKHLVGLTSFLQREHGTYIGS
jgi:hypothetical protein